MKVSIEEVIKALETLRNFVCDEENEIEYAHLMDHVDGMMLTRHSEYEFESNLDNLVNINDRLWKVIIAQFMEAMK